MSAIDYKNGGLPALPANVRLASPKQVALIARLAEERDHDIPALHNLIARAAEGVCSMQGASQAIDVLFGLPRKPQANALAAGYYLLGETVYKVVKAKHSENLYAKRLDVVDGKGTWEYQPGALRVLKDAVTLTVEAAASLGAHLGVCVICGATLTDPESVARGIGPVCAARL
jgi:hypothetical protein